MWRQAEGLSKRRSGCRDERKVCVFMSWDRKDPGDDWQDPPSATSNWQQLPNQFPIVDSELVHSPTDPADAEEEYAGAQKSSGAPELEDSHAHTPRPARASRKGSSQNASPIATEPAFSPIEMLKSISQYITLILVPLVFCGLTCLFILPRVTSDQAVLGPEGFWPILVVMVAVTIAQIVAVYYAGSDNGMWTLGTIGGLSLFILIACFSVYGLMPGLLVMVVLVAVGIILIRRCVHPVPEGLVDIVFSFKKYSRTLYPGFNILLPWEQISTQLNIEEVQWMCPAQIIQLSRDEDVMLRGVISYQLLQEDAHLAITQLHNWEASLRTLFQTTLQTIPTVFVPEDFLIWPNGRHPGTVHPGDDDFTSGFARREHVNNHLFQIMRDKAALWGVQINWVSVRDIEIAPHGSIKIEAIQSLPPAVSPAKASSQTAPVQPITNSSHGYSHVSDGPASHPSHPEHESPATTGKASYDITPNAMIHAYKEVQSGKITDPETIRSIAAKFVEVAEDPEASQGVSFDAAAAANNLYEQAHIQELSYANGRTSS